MFLLAIMPQEVLDKVEANFREPRAMITVSIMTLSNLDGSGKEVRISKTWVLKDYARMTKFLSPAGQRGVGVLIKHPGTPSEVIYLYLPAFRRVRRIASSSMKSSSFQGTDFSYSDLSSGLSYKKDYKATSVEVKKGPDGTVEEYVLTLVRKPGSHRPYSRIVLHVDSKFFIKKAELYDDKGLWKVLEVSKVKNFFGYNVPVSIAMKDLRRKHMTSIDISTVKINPPALKESFFTIVNLRRPPK